MRKNNYLFVYGGGVEKVFKKSLLILLLAVLPLLSFADDYLHFGLNYSPTISDGNISHAIGGNFSAIGDYGGAKKIYAAFGFNADVTNRDSLVTADLKKLGVNDFNSRFFAVPLRVGYPVFVKINETTKFNFIPSLAFDIQFFHCDFKQNYLGYKLNYKMSGWGYSLGISANVGMQHQINKIYLRYGVDVDLPFMTMLLYDVEYSGAVKGKTSDSSVTSIADYLTVSVSPYISVGFKLGREK